MASCLSLKLKPLISFPWSGSESPKLSPPPPVQISFRFCTCVISGVKVAAGFASDEGFEAYTYGYGCMVVGCPRRVPLSDNDIQMDLDRWRPHECLITPCAKEIDKCQIAVGVVNGLSTGKIISVNLSYADERLPDLKKMRSVYRPSHADSPYNVMYGSRSIQSCRTVFPSETFGRVAAGAIAKKMLKTLLGVEVLAYVSQVDNVILPDGLIDHQSLTTKLIDSNIIRCPDPEYSAKMISALRVRGDSANGVVTCIVRNASRGVGLPISDKVVTKLAKTLFDYLKLRITELVGVSQEKGSIIPSENSDFYSIFQVAVPCSICKNLGSGYGPGGGISNGEIINLRIEFLPPATIRKYHQNSALRNMEETELVGQGQDDPGLAPKVVPLVEAVVALELANALIS